MIAALYVERGGCYYGLPDVDPWDQERDATLYAGPHPVVAHPPCARWGRLAALCESLYGIPQGQDGDGGTFAAAYVALRRWGGVLEHPAETNAWAVYGLPRPPGLWVCSVDQSCYGHEAQKRTWLAYFSPSGSPPFALDWRTMRTKVLVAGAPGQDRHARKREGVRLMRKADRIRTPPAFRDVLLELARTA